MAEGVLFEAEAPGDGVADPGEPPGAGVVAAALVAPQGRVRPASWSWTVDQCSALARHLILHAEDGDRGIHEQEVVNAPRICVQSGRRRVEA